MTRQDLLHHIQSVVADLAAQLGVGYHQDRESPIRDSMLPAVNLRRGSDMGREGDHYPSTGRTLALLLDVFAVGEQRQERLDSIETTLRHHLQQLASRSEAIDALRIDINWDVDELALPFMAARLHLTVDYWEGEAW